ncbi:Ferric uptake regulation protein [Austwickia sp. TVS 96-490-7B]|uniref:Fur family transcriptional regulator n=1 Tax=Austwickia sp. TVS 96-490-7B TaxID=2830843 RepID=UPI001C55DBF3|nr:Fur family transcriptional regulator [Austwickia sp. TVS 96-490-7B]MBW3083858.1 Ferric uptake regulation protein [Austwickia sp. TVS 96-490-7B]
MGTASTAADEPDDALAPEVTKALRARGMRMTTQRERVLAAVSSVVHATPDALAAVIAADGGPPLSLSTVYRNLEALQRVGVVSCTSMGQRAPSYHLATHTDHVHLVCRGCGEIAEVTGRFARDLAESVEKESGFVVDSRHLALQGWCRHCADVTAARSEA